MATEPGLYHLFDDAEASALLDQAIKHGEWRVFDPPDWPDWLDLEAHTFSGLPVRTFVAFGSSESPAVFVVILPAEDE